MAVALKYNFKFKNINGDYKVVFEVEKVREIPIENNEIIEESVENKENTDESLFEDDVNFLRSLDPKEWKDQDHYRVLGIGKLRIKATEDDIRRAYRKMVLKYHPDKRKAQGEKIEVMSDDDFFTCITKAYEILGGAKRRSYDSVDPFFDDSLPSNSELKKDFFETFTTYFKLNSRWSERQPVPSLGTPTTPRPQVEHFYTFWYNFESWREFSYLDEEEKEKGQDRDERRWIEKQNKVARQKRKKEEMTRIRNLVDLAYNADPRIAKFKQDDKDKKLAQKQAKLAQIQAKKEQEMKEALEAKLAQEKIELELKQKNEERKQEKENLRKALKRERKIFRDTCKANNYFCENDEENLSHMTAIEKICESLSVLELEELNKNLKANGRETFLTTVKNIEEKIEMERQENLMKIKQEKKIESEILKKREIIWNEDNLQLLIKAVNLFPAGTNQRWEVVANFINQHKDEVGSEFNSKDVLNKAKDLLQNTDYSKSGLKVAANKQAYSNFEKDKQNARVLDNTEISQKIDSKDSKSQKIVSKHLENEKSQKKDHSKSQNDMKSQQNGSKSQNDSKSQKIDSNDSKSSQKIDISVSSLENVPWTPNEQMLLEQALKTYSNSTPDRWDKIADCIPTRSKKDCMKRYKELVEIVKAKKAAQNALKTK